jgi:UDP-GlcNAc:undecaprenyl-phosphate GlcNAc-1-phosphate transferase
VPYFARSLPLVAAIQLGALWLSGKYRLASTRLTSSDVVRLVQGSFLGVAASVIALLYIYGFAGYSREVFAFDAVFAPVFVVGLRVALSTVDQYLRLRRSRGRTAVIYGAGRGGALALRELLQNPALGLTPVGFIDDDPAKRRQRVDGLPVLGSLEDLPALSERLPGTLSTLVVSIEGLPRERWDRLHDLCAVRGISITRMRMQFEDVPRPGQPGSVVRFPGASA